jgi:hypothetical protein
MTYNFKPVKKERKPARMNRIGKVGRERLNVVAELNDQWGDESWYNTCEIAPILYQWGYADVVTQRCLGNITWAHARKHRAGTAALGSPFNDYTAARGCSYHHMSIMDLLNPDTVEHIVLEAIRRREEQPNE